MPDNSPQNARTEQEIDDEILTGALKTAVAVLSSFLFFKNENNEALLSKLALIIISSDFTTRAVSQNRFSLFSIAQKAGQGFVNYYRYQMDELNDETLEEFAEDFASQEGSEQISSRRLGQL